MKRLIIISSMTILLLLGIIACQEITAYNAQQTTASTDTPTAASTVASPTPRPTTAPTKPAPTAAPAALTVELDTTIDLEHIAGNQTFIFHFNQPMNPDLTKYPAVLEPFVPGSYSWDDTFSTLTFTPDKPLESDFAYELSLARALQSQSGVSFSPPPTWQFEIDHGPTIVTRQPSGSAITQRDQSFQLTFSEPMDEASVAAALTVDPPLEYELVWSGRILTIAPLEKFTPAQSYHFMISRTAVSAAGTPLAYPYEWTSTISGIVFSATGPTGADHNMPLTIRFRHNVSKESALDNFHIEPALDGELSWQAPNDLVFTPNSFFALDTVYTVSFAEGLLDEENQPLPSPEPLTFGPYSAVLFVRPTGQAMSPFDHIEIVFDRPLDESTVEDAFSISPAIAGTVSFEETTLSFQPDQGYFAPNTNYEVTLDDTLRSAAGEPIFQEPSSWAFRTGVLEDMASFGWGPNAQLLDADGRRAVQFLMTRNYVDTPISFELYQLDMPQFLAEYSSNFKGNFSSSEVILTTAGRPLVKTWEMQTVEALQPHTNIQELTIPSDVPPGLYILNLNAGLLNDQLILVLTRNTLMVKQAEGQLVSWVTDIQGGHQEGVEVGIYTRDGELLGSGQTNASGIFELDLNHRDPAPLIVVAQDGSDVTVSGLSWEWQNAGSYGGWWQTQGTADDYAAHIYTDRPIYKPGQTVYYKAIVRSDDDAMLDMLPAGTSVTVRIRDARNNVVRTEPYTTNNFGTVTGTFQLADGAMLGDYQVEITLEATDTRKAYVKKQAFKVEDYRKPDYSVDVSVNADRLMNNQQLEVTVEAQYYYGEPVANAEVTINQFTLTDIYYWDEDRNDFQWYDAGQLNNTFRTDENGRATFTLTTKADYSGRAVDWRTNVTRSMWAVEATVNDGSQQAVSGFARYDVYNVAAKLKVNTNGYFKKPGESFTISAEMVDLFDQPLDGRTLTARFMRYNYSNSGYSYTEIASIEFTTDASGRATGPVTIDEAGYYEVKVTGRDRHGNMLEYTSWIYIFDRDFSYWYGRSNDGTISIRPEREAYAPGDTARLIVESAVSGPAILTFERGTTRREELVELTAPVTILETPIVETDAPNIFVSINQYQPQTEVVNENTWSSLPDAHLRTATTELSVPVTNKTLIVTITPDQETYKPRQQATFTVRVTNQQGDPVSAELSLAMVDEAIYALSEDLSEPLFESFYYDRNNIVTTYNSLQPTRDLGGGRGGGGGGGDGNIAGAPRSDFPDTAAWYPRLHTDANGEAQVTLTLPDNLTTWRLTSKATTADTQVGESITTFIVSKDIIVRPLLPRTLTAGDEILLSAMVQNYSALALTFDVNISAVDDLSGAEVMAFPHGASQKITLQPGESRIIGWSAVASQASNARINVSAVFQDQLLDGVELPLPIKPLAVADVQTFIGQFRGAQTVNFDVPAAALPQSTVKVELSRSIAGTLFEGLEYLTGFPYGCVEQTMSRALPNAVVGRAFNQLGIANPTLQADLPVKINASVQRLYGFQHPDGGWGWWYDDPSDYYQTAWVIFGLINTAEAGYEIDPAVIKRGTIWLRDELPHMDRRTRAYALYSMALAVDFIDDPAAADEHFPTAAFVLERIKGLESQSWNALDPFSQASLALGVWQLGDSATARTMLDSLAETAVHDSATGQVYWGINIEDGYYSQKTMASRTRTTAQVLSAFSRIQPQNEFTDGIVSYLMSQRQQQGWGTTNETSFAIIGLTDYLLATSFSEGATETTYAVILNGETVASGNLGRGEPAVTVELPAELFKTGSNQLRLEQGGAGQLYYGVKRTVFVAQEEIAAAGSIAIERHYLNMEGQPIDIDTVAPGDLVTVRLRVTTNADLSYVIVEDKIPGGLEALNERLNITTHSATTPPQYYWQDYGYNHKEIFGDRVSFFITELNRGTHVYEYKTRVTHSGTYVAMPAEAYAMYDLASWGRSASQVLAIPAE